MSIHACFWAVVFGILLGDLAFVAFGYDKAKDTASQLWSVTMFYTTILLFWDRKGKQE